jgi:hypothetical protein
MLSAREYCQWLSQEPGIRRLIAIAVANAVAARPTAQPTAPPTAPPTDVDAALDTLAAHGILFRRTPVYGGHDVTLIAGKPEMLKALHVRERR